MPLSAALPRRSCVTLHTYLLLHELDPRLRETSRLHSTPHVLLSLRSSPGYTFCKPTSKHEHSFRRSSRRLPGLTAPFLVDDAASSSILYVHVSNQATFGVPPPFLSTTRNSQHCVFLLSDVTIWHNRLIVFLQAVARHGRGVDTHLRRGHLPLAALSGDVTIRITAISSTPSCARLGLPVERVCTNIRHHATRRRLVSRSPYLTFASVVVKHLAVLLRSFTYGRIL